MPTSLFNIHQNDDVHGLIMSLIQYSLHNVFELYRVDIDAEEGCSNNEEGSEKASDQPKWFGHVPSYED